MHWIYDLLNLSKQCDVWSTDQNQWFNGTLLGHRFIGPFDAAHIQVISDNWSILSCIQITPM